MPDGQVLQETLSLQLRARSRPPLPVTQPRVRLHDVGRFGTMVPVEAEPVPAQGAVYLPQPVLPLCRRRCEKRGCARNVGQRLAERSIGRRDRGKQPVCRSVRCETYVSGLPRSAGPIMQPWMPSGSSGTRISSLGRSSSSPKRGRSLPSGWVGQTLPREGRDSPRGPAATRFPPSSRRDVMRPSAPCWTTSRVAPG